MALCSTPCRRPPWQRWEDMSQHVRGRQQEQGDKCEGRDPRICRSRVQLSHVFPSRRPPIGQRVRTDPGSRTASTRALMGCGPLAAPPVQLKLQPVRRAPRPVARDNVPAKRRPAKLPPLPAAKFLDNGMPAMQRETELAIKPIRCSLELFGDRSVPQSWPALAPAASIHFERGGREPRTPDEIDGATQFSD